MKSENSDEVVLVFDCGSTNLRVVAINSQGTIKAQFSFPNEPKPQNGRNPEWLIWDLDEVWSKLCKASREVVAKIDPGSIKAATVITWGADGAPVDRNGRLLYPVISWQCPRTVEAMKNLTSTLSPFEIFRITGYQLTPFNTLIKLYWLRKHELEVLSKAYTWLMMAGLIAQRLTGEFHIDPTSASTMMAMDLGRRDWSKTMLELVGLDPGFFPKWREPGQVVGDVTKEAEKGCGIPNGVPVVAGGHDSQFAIFGSMATENEAVLSSGTWEILGHRSNVYSPTKEAFDDGVIVEADVSRGFWNPQLLMMGSAVLEWVADKMVAEKGSTKYEALIKMAESVPAGAGGVVFVPSFVKETGPTKKYGVSGAILGLTLRATRNHIVRATFEGLSYQLAQALKILEREKGSNIKKIRVVGGGSKNRLWNQIRADITGLPVTVTDLKECASLGAALVSFLGIGRFNSFEEAKANVRVKEETFSPSENRKIYESLLRNYEAAVKSLKTPNSAT
ncbi:L-fuculokinase [Candidatus Bathyarchaeota archaeon]|nr:L-fuculokinase [Candidatus Bathyarchaeota archaeon]